MQKLYSIFSVIVIVAAVIIMMPGILDFLKGLGRFALLISSAIVLSIVAATLIAVFRKRMTNSLRIPDQPIDQQETEP